MLSKSIIQQSFYRYIDYCDYYNIINKNLSNKQIRRPAFPEFISEHVILFFLQKHHTIDHTFNWDIKTGDLEKIDSSNTPYKIEVKCVTSNGPISFGPSQTWHELYILDARDTVTNTTSTNNIKIYKIQSLDLLKLIKVNKFETFNDHCINKRRPRISLDLLTNNIEIPNLCECIFSGNINELI